MGSPDSPSRTSPIILLALLGSLGLSFIVLIRRCDQLPGVITQGRNLSGDLEMQRFKQDLQKAFLMVSDWGELCRNPQTLISTLSPDGRRHFQVENPRWEEARPYFPSSERDASFRCRSAQFQGDQLRSKFCFHIAGGTDPVPSEVNMLELNLEWYGKDPRRPLSCKEALATDSDLELAVYYSYYRALDRSGEEWTFRRLAGGMRLAPLRFKPLAVSAASEAVLPRGG